MVKRSPRRGSGENIPTRYNATMRDPRLEKLADVLVSYSVGVSKGQVVRIGGEHAAAPLMLELYAKVLAAGGHPFVQPTFEQIDEHFYKHASTEQLSFVNPVRAFEVEHIDCHIGIWADENTRAMTNVDPTR